MFISFAHPVYLFALFTIPLLVFLHFFGLKTLRGRSLKFANFEAIARIKGIDFYSKNLFLLVFNILFIVLLVLALAGTALHTELSASAFSFVIAIDSSGSMSATDILPDRFSAAKETAKDFVNNLPADSYVGILSFSGDSNIEQELTKNKLDLTYSIDNIEISNVGGTDVADAIINSARLLDNEKRKAVILLSDGQVNTGEIDEAIEDINKMDVIVHTFGIGTVEGGEVGFGLSKLDEDSLKSLAYNTGGQYFSAESNEELRESFDEIVEVTERLGKVELDAYLIMAVLVLFILKQFLLSMNKLI